MTKYTSANDDWMVEQLAARSTSRATSSPTTWPSRRNAACSSSSVARTWRHRVRHWDSLSGAAGRRTLLQATSGAWSGVPRSTKGATRAVEAGIAATDRTARFSRLRETGASSSRSRGAVRPRSSRALLPAHQGGQPSWTPPSTDRTLRRAPGCRCSPTGSGSTTSSAPSTARCGSTARGHPLRDGPGGMQSIATSRGRDDAGMFELNFRDERYLPFEGAGVVSNGVSSYRRSRQFDYRTIGTWRSILQYTAPEGGQHSGRGGRRVEEADRRRIDTLNESAYPPARARKRTCHGMGAIPATGRGAVRRPAADRSCWKSSRPSRAREASSSMPWNWCSSPAEATAVRFPRRPDDGQGKGDLDVNLPTADELWYRRR